MLSPGVTILNTCYYPSARLIYIYTSNSKYMIFKYKFSENTAIFTKVKGTIAYIARVDVQNNPLGTFTRLKGIKA